MIRQTFLDYFLRSCHKKLLSHNVFTAMKKSWNYRRIAGKKIRKIYNLIWNNLKICHDVLAATKVFLRSLTTCNCVSTDLEFYLAIDCALTQNPPSAHDVLNIFASRSQRNKNARWLNGVWICISTILL